MDILVGHFPRQFGSILSFILSFIGHVVLLQVHARLYQGVLQQPGGPSLCLGLQNRSKSALKSGFFGRTISQSNLGWPEALL